jgi:hypothetical protein
MIRRAQTLLMAWKEKTDEASLLTEELSAKGTRYFLGCAYPQDLR